MRNVFLSVAVLALAACGAGDDSADEGTGEATVERAGMAFASVNTGALPGAALCGDPLIRGEAVGFYDGKGGCDIEDAVRVTQIGNVTLSQPAFIGCEAARAFRDWVGEVAVPIVGDTGGGLAELRVAASYACRTRNHKTGAKISEHGYGKAIDISGVTTRDGSVYTVLEHWNSADFQSRLRAMHAQACGTFGTVLGPGSDGYHEDHFHFDVASYRNGPYCK